MEKIYIVGDRVTLRSPEERDREILRRLMNDPEVESTIMGSHFPVSKMQQEYWYENIYPNENAIRLMIDSPEGITVGTTACANIDWENMTADIGGKIMREYRGKKYGYYTAYYFNEYLFFKRGFKRMLMRYIDTNKANAPMHKRLGAVFEGVQRGSMFKNGKRVNIALYSLGPEDLIPIKE